MGYDPINEYMLTFYLIKNIISIAFYLYHFLNYVSNCIVDKNSHFLNGTFSIDFGMFEIGGEHHHFL